MKTKLSDSRAILGQGIILFDNVQQSRLVVHNREIKKIGNPIDKTEWGMTPQTVNAYYAGASYEKETSKNPDGSTSITTTTSVSGGVPVYGAVQTSLINENGNMSVRSGYANGASLGLFLVPSVNFELGVELKRKKDD